MPLNSDPSHPDLILVNPAAGGGRSKEALPRLREFAEQHGWSVEFCMTANAEELAAKAREAAAAGRERLFALGGDGPWRGRSEHISFIQMGCEARKLPAPGGIFFLTSTCSENLHQAATLVSSVTL